MKHLSIVLAAGIVFAGCTYGGLGTKTAAPEEQEQEQTKETTPSGMTEEATTPEASDKSTVSFTDQGFSPQEITVKIGTTVAFINDSSSGMWVASAVHPTHQELPGFDQLTSVGRGESYEYTFTKAGDWRFHNHVAPASTGIVHVAP